MPTLRVALHEAFVVEHYFVLDVFQVEKHRGGDEQPVLQRCLAAVAKPAK